MNLLPGAFAAAEATFFRVLERLMVFLLSGMVLMEPLRRHQVHPRCAFAGGGQLARRRHRRSL